MNTWCLGKDAYIGERTVLGHIYIFMNIFERKSKISNVKQKSVKYRL